MAHETVAKHGIKVEGIGLTISDHTVNDIAVNDDTVSSSDSKLVTTGYLNGKYAQKVDGYTHRSFQTAVELSSTVSEVLTHTDGTALHVNFIYRLRMTCMGTGSDTGSSYIIWYDQTETIWKSHLVSRTDVTNTPTAFVDVDGIVKLNNAHTSLNYFAKVYQEAWDTTSDDTHKNMLGIDSVLSYDGIKVTVPALTVTVNTHLDGWTYLEGRTYVTSELYPRVTNTANLGHASYVWSKGYIKDLYTTSITEDGTLLSAKYASIDNAIKTYTIDLTGESTDEFIPVILSGSAKLNNIYEFSVGSANKGTVVPYNDHTLVGRARGGGYTDQKPFYDITQSFYVTSEKSILGLYKGTQTCNGVIIYLRGGISYEICTDAPDVIYGDSSSVGTTTVYNLDASGDPIGIANVNIEELVNIIDNDNTHLMSGQLDVQYSARIGTTLDVISTISEAGTLLSNKYAAKVHDHAFSTLTSKPTTLSGYGITDAYTRTEINTKVDANTTLISTNTTDITTINTLLSSDDNTLDSLQEIVDFITLNRSDLDALTIAGIAGLTTELSTFLKTDGSRSMTGPLTLVGNRTEGTNANIVLKPTTSTGGSTAISFESFVNASSDRGFIKWLDDSNDHTGYEGYSVDTGDSSSETGLLIVGTANDTTGTNQDNVLIKPAGDLYLDASTSIIVGTYTNQKLKINTSTGDLDVSGSIKESGTLLSSKYSAMGHGHVISDVTDLQNTLNTYLKLSGGSLSGDLSIVSNSNARLLGFVIPIDGYGSSALNSLSFRHDKNEFAHARLKGWTITETGTKTFGNSVDNFFNEKGSCNNLYDSSNPGNDYSIEILPSYTMGNSANTHWRFIVSDHTGLTSASNLIVEIKNGASTWEEVYNGPTNSKLMMQDVTISVGTVKGIRFTFQNITNNCYVNHLGLEGKLSALESQWYLNKSGDTMYGTLNAPEFKESGISLSSKYAPLSHNHAISDITDLPTTLAGLSLDTHDHDDLYSILTHNHGNGTTGNLPVFTDGANGVIGDSKVTQVVTGIVVDGDIGTSTWGDFVRKVYSKTVRINDGDIAPTESMLQVSQYSDSYSGDLAYIESAGLGNGLRISRSNSGAGATDALCIQTAAGRAIYAKSDVATYTVYVEGGTTASIYAKNGIVSNGNITAISGFELGGNQVHDILISTDNASTSDDALVTAGYISATYSGTGHDHNNDYLKLTGGTLTGDLIIEQNFTVLGETTTLNSTNVMVDDVVFTLGNGNTSDALDIGFIGIRASDNIGIIWDESADEFATVFTDSDGSTEGNTNILSYADFRADNIKLGQVLDFTKGSPFINMGLSEWSNRSWFAYNWNAIENSGDGFTLNTVGNSGTAASYLFTQHRGALFPLLEVTNNLVVGSNITEAGTLLSAKYAPISHTHDDLYYTESEVDSLISGYSITAHNHDSDYLKLTGGTLTGGLDVNGSVSFENNKIKTFTNDGMNPPSDNNDLLDSYVLALARSDGAMVAGVISYTATNGNSNVSWHSRHDHVWMHNNIERMRLSGGDGTIGTLHVHGDINTSKLTVSSISTTPASINLESVSTGINQIVMRENGVGKFYINHFNSSYSESARQNHTEFTNNSNLFMSVDGEGSIQLTSGERVNTILGSSYGSSSSSDTALVTAGYVNQRVFDASSGSYLPLSGGDLSGGLTIIHDDGLFIKSSTNAVGAIIKFSDQTGYAQRGQIAYYHADNAVVAGSGDGFIISGTEANTFVRIDGRLTASDDITVTSTGVNGAELHMDSDLTGYSRLNFKVDGTSKASILYLGASFSGSSRQEHIEFNNASIKYLDIAPSGEASFSNEVTASDGIASMGKWVSSSDYARFGKVGRNTNTGYGYIQGGGTNDSNVFFSAATTDGVHLRIGNIDKLIVYNDYSEKDGSIYVTTATKIAIQGALDRANTLGGARVVLKPQLYLLNSPLIIYSNTILSCYGATLRRTWDTLDNLLRTAPSMTTTAYSAVQNITIEGGTWDMNSSFNTDGTAIGTFESRNVHIKDCVFKNISNWHAIELNSTKDAFVTGCTFKDGTVGSDNCEFIQLDCSFASFTYVFPWDEASRYWGNNPCKNISIDNCVFENGSSGLGTHSYIKDVMHTGISITNCKFNTLSEYGVRAIAWTNIKIDNNVFTDIGVTTGDDYAVAIYVETNSVMTDSSYLDGISISNNHIYNARWRGIYLKDTYNATTTRNIRNFTITGNTIRASTVATEYDVGIMLEGCQYGVINSNSVMNYKSTGAGIYAKYSTELVINGNQCQGHVANADKRGVYVNSSTYIAISSNIVDGLLLLNQTKCTCVDNIVDGNIQNDQEPTANFTANNGNVIVSSVSGKLNASGIVKFTGIIVFQDGWTNANNYAYNNFAYVYGNVFNLVASKSYYFTVMYVNCIIVIRMVYSTNYTRLSANSSGAYYVTGNGQQYNFEGASVAVKDDVI